MYCTKGMLERFAAAVEESRGVDVAGALRDRIETIPFEGKMSACSEETLNRAFKRTAFESLIEEFKGRLSDFCSENDLQVSAETPQAYIGREPFGITPEEIETQQSEAERERAAIITDLERQDLDPDFRSSLNRRKGRIEGLLQASPEEILQTLRAVYDFVTERERGGAGQGDIVRQLTEEEPELVAAAQRFYDVFRLRDWGYKLFQGLSAFRLSRN